MKRFVVLMAVVVLLAGVPGRVVIAMPAAQTSVTLNTDQEVSVGYNADRDEKVAYDSTEDAVRFGNYLAPAPLAGRSFFRAYLRFPLGSIPSGSTIHGARLELYVYDRRFGMGGDLNAGLYRVTTGGWTEAGLKNTSNWTWGTLPGFASTPESTTTVAAVDQWYSWDVTALAQAWLNGSVPQYGMMLSTDPPENGTVLTDDQAVGARSRAGAFPTNAPRLVISYSPPAAPAPTPRPPSGEIPEPSTLALLGGGLAALWGAVRLGVRRRR